MEVVELNQPLRPSHVKPEQYDEAICGKLEWMAKYFEHHAIVGNCKFSAQSQYFEGHLDTEVGHMVDFISAVRYYNVASDLELVMAFIYMDRMIQRGLQFNRKNLYNIFVVSVVLAGKFTNDNAYTNKDLAKVSGIPLKLLNKYERHCLSIIDFDLNCSDMQLFMAMQSINMLLPSPKECCVPDLE